MSSQSIYPDTSLSEDEERSFFTLLDLFPNTSPEIIVNTLKNHSGNCDAAIDHLISLSNHENQNIDKNEMEQSSSDPIIENNQAISQDISASTRNINPFESNNEDIQNVELMKKCDHKCNEYYENSFTVMEKEISQLRNKIDNFKRVIAFKDEVIQEKENHIKELIMECNKKDNDIKELNNQIEDKDKELKLKHDEAQLFSDKLLECRKKIEKLEWLINQSSLNNENNATNQVFNAIESFQVESKLKRLYEEFKTHITKELEKL